MKLMLLYVFASLLSNLQAQTIKESKWVASLGEEVHNIYSTPLNVPLIQTKSGKLIALEPSTGAILWNNPLYVNKIAPLDGTPCSFVNGNLLLDINSGRSIDLSKLFSGKMEDFYVIPESYDLFIHSTNPEFFTVVDLYELKMRWTMKSDISGKSLQEGKGKLGAAFMQMNSPNLETGLECPPITNKSGGVIIAGFGKLSSIDPDGKVLWSVTQPKKKKGMVQTVDNKTELMVDDNRPQFYLMKSKMMTALSTGDGSEIWPEFYAVKGDVLVDTETGLLPLTGYHEQGNGGTSMFAKTKINLVDYATGKALWPDDLELKGAVDQFKILPNGNIAIVTFNQTNSKFQVLDPRTGKFSYPEEIKLKGRVIDFVAGPDKVMFATSRGIDLLDLNTGNNLLSKMPKFDEDADIRTIYNKQFVYNIDTKNKDVYKTDLLTGESNKILRTYKFAVGEPLKKYDVLPDGKLFLASDHNMKVYSPTGDLLIDKPFDYEGRGWDRYNRAVNATTNTFGAVTNTVLLSVDFAVSAVVVLATTGTQYESAGHEFAREIQAPELETHRINKNQKAAEYYFNMKRLRKDVAAQGSFFVRRNKADKESYVSYVSKGTGDIIFDIPLEEDATAPEFAVGEDIGYLYYAPSFINQNKPSFDFIFNKERLKTAEANNKAGFIAGYQFD